MQSSSISPSISIERNLSPNETSTYLVNDRLSPLRVTLSNLPDKDNISLKQSSISEFGSYKSPAMNTAPKKPSFIWYFATILAFLTTCASFGATVAFGPSGYTFGGWPRTLGATILYALLTLGVYKNNLAMTRGLARILAIFYISFVIYGVVNIETSVDPVRMQYAVIGGEVLVFVIVVGFALAASRNFDDPELDTLKQV